MVQKIFSNFNAVYDAFQKQRNENPRGLVITSVALTILGIAAWRRFSATPPPKISHKTRTQLGLPEGTRGFENTITNFVDQNGNIIPDIKYIEFRKPRFNWWTGRYEPRKENSEFYIDY